MRDMINIAIFGDSIMKGTLLDESGRYRPCFNEAAKPLLDRFPICITNHARFGSTIEKGLATVRRALSPLAELPRYALIEFGGNDCNFDWRSVASDPEGEHGPAVPLPRFIELMEKVVQEHISAGVTPVLMSLPPIDAERYFQHITGSGLDAAALLRFIGEPGTIYRYQEMYSNAIMEFALTKGLPFINVRPAFLTQGSAPFSELIAQDGLHLSRRGYELLRGCFESRLAAIV